MNATKSVCITGNLSNGSLSYICSPSNELSEKKWRLAIASVIFDSKDQISVTCVISCNFVTSRQRQLNGDIDICEQPLNIFHLKTSSQAPRGIFRFCMYIKQNL